MTSKLWKKDWATVDIKKDEGGLVNCGAMIVIIECLFEQAMNRFFVARVFEVSKP